MHVGPEARCCTCRVQLRSLVLVLCRVRVAISMPDAAVTGGSTLNANVVRREGLSVLHSVRETRADRVDKVARAPKTAASSGCAWRWSALLWHQRARCHAAPIGLDMPLLRPCALSALQRPAAPTLRRTSGALAAARALVRTPCRLPAVLRTAGKASRTAAAPGSRSARLDVSAGAGQRPLQAGGMSAPESVCLLTTSITATTVQAALVELQEAEAAGADVVELRLDFLQGFQPATDLPALLAGTKLPAIVTYRPNWEGGKYEGVEDARLHALWLAVELKAAYVDVELKAAAPFFAASPQGWQRSTNGTRFILSSHNYSETPSVEDLRALHARAVAAGADIVKIATTAQRIVDVARLEALLSQERDKPTIALGMGEPGLVSRSAAARQRPPAARGIDCDWMIARRSPQLTRAAACHFSGVSAAGAKVRILSHLWRVAGWKGIGPWAAHARAAALYLPPEQPGARHARAITSAALMPHARRAAQHGCLASSASQFLTAAAQFCTMRRLSRSGRTSCTSRCSSTTCPTFCIHPCLAAAILRVLA